MNILLTGASGLVGAAFAQRAAAAGHVVTGIVGRWPAPLPGLSRQLALDLQAEAPLVALVRDTRPDWIVNAAAISEPAECEARPDEAWRLNVALPGYLARAAREVEARFIHLSTEQVFDGTRPPYAVGDARRAINRYARHKLEAEDLVLATAPERAVVLRLPLLMGNSPGQRRSVHERLLMLWAAGKPAKLYADEIRQTCTADSVARALVEICGRSDVRGACHWAGAEPRSRLEIGEGVRAHFGLSAERAPIVAVARRDDPAAAASRQADLSLDLQPLADRLGTRPQSFAEALAELKTPDWWKG
ncbi:MAG TPA: sugar nucleotide-binding protein [Lacunisphaera sp.]|nr:sugar nucleotide-binding protein [Lacunisphaera sp.]